jgi:hypothetical protein
VRSVTLSGIYLVHLPGGEVEIPYAASSPAKLCIPPDLDGSDICSLLVFHNGAAFDYCFWKEKEKTK